MGTNMQPKPARAKAIIVDDSATFMRSICAFLVRLNALEIVATADNAPQALELVKQFQPQLVLMDLQMPEMNGLEATARLRESFPEIRVIMVTGHDTPELRRASRESGAQGFVLKSRLVEELPAVLSSVLASLKPDPAA